MVRRWALWGILVWLLAGLLVGTNVAAACQTSEGQILMPWGPVPPVSSDPIRALHGVVFYEIDNFESGQEFSLRPVGSSGTVCVSNECAHRTDYNVAFYREGGPVDEMVESFDDPGPVEGVVPNEVDFALVWMQTGLSVPVAGGLLSIDDRFSWRVGC